MELRSKRASRLGGASVGAGVVSARVVKEVAFSLDRRQCERGLRERRGQRREGIGWLRTLQPRTLPMKFPGLRIQTINLRLQLLFITNVRFLPELGNFRADFLAHAGFAGCFSFRHVVVGVW